MRQSFSDFRLCQAEFGGNARYCNFLDPDFGDLGHFKFPVMRYTATEHWGELR
jgi:hypothetical protein